MKRADAYDLALAYCRRYLRSTYATSTPERERHVVELALSLYGSSLGPTHARRLRSQLRADRKGVRA